LVSQKSWLFAGNVADNLSLYENFSDEEMEEVLKKVHLWDELGDKPLQFKIESEGSNLSGGQAQRLTIARGLLRHKRLFLLDEITSSLDKENSHAIRKLIYTLPIMTVEVAHNIDAELVKQYGIEIRKLTKNGLS
jgi:ATP-binding cassette subfamily B protein